MQEVVITYETLYELLRREKQRPELQSLPNSFYQDVKVYLTEKEKIFQTQKTKESIFASESQKTEKTIQNTHKILKELYERRESKILQLAISASRINSPQDTNMLLEQEKDLYKEVKLILDSARKELLISLITAKTFKEEEIKEKNEPKDIKRQDENPKLLTRKIRIIQPVPQFMGDDEKIYGPFLNEETAELPLKIAELLIEKKRAEQVL